MVGHADGGVEPSRSLMVQWHYSEQSSTAGLLQQAMRSKRCVLVVLKRCGVRDNEKEHAVCLPRYHD
jgi:hypothetical protein